MNLTDPLRELLGFLGAFLSLGPVGLRYGVLSPALGAKRADAARTDLLRSIGRRAAGLGLAGTVLAAALMLAAVMCTWWPFSDSPWLSRVGTWGGRSRRWAPWARNSAISWPCSGRRW
jgi:hypothetical protein